MPFFAHAQGAGDNSQAESAVRTVINNYSKSRQLKDSLLLESILTNDIDQLVSSGTWRHGKKTSMEGMMRSSRVNAGTRTITIEKIRFLTDQCAIVDTRYEIKRTDGTQRNMWSTFILIKSEEWKITAIRNMLPAG